MLITYSALCRTHAAIEPWSTANEESTNVSPTTREQLIANVLHRSNVVNKLIDKRKPSEDKSAKQSFIQPISNTQIDVAVSEVSLICNYNLQHIVDIKYRCTRMVGK
jgi:hypothetical protein